MEKQPAQIEQLKHVPEPAESFEIEFLNTKGTEVRNAMREMGGFSFRSGGCGYDSEPHEKEGVVHFNGERRDGTKIKIIIEKGVGYKSPAEIAKEEKELAEKNKT